MKISKSIKITAVLALAMAAFGFVNSAQAVAFNYVGNPNNDSEIVFPGDTTFPSIRQRITSNHHWKLLWMPRLHDRGLTRLEPS